MNNNTTKPHEAVEVPMLESKEAYREFYEKELNCKKHILECIEQVRKQDKDTLQEEQWQEVYNAIYNSIEKLSTEIKANTVLQLKNELKSGLAKRVKILDPVETTTFIEFFKEAYPEGKRRKEFTWVLADPSKITDEQILHTLKYISNWCSDNRLSSKQKEDVKGMIERLERKRNIKYINQVKSLEGLKKDRALGEYIKNIQLNGPKKERKFFIGRQS